MTQEKEKKQRSYQEKMSGILELEHQITTLRAFGNSVLREKWGDVDDLSSDTRTLHQQLYNKPDSAITPKEEELVSNLEGKWQGLGKAVLKDAPLQNAKLADVTINTKEEAVKATHEADKVNHSLYTLAHMNVGDNSQVLKVYRSSIETTNRLFDRADEIVRAQIPESDVDKALAENAERRAQQHILFGEASIKIYEAELEKMEGVSAEWKKGVKVVLEARKDELLTMRMQAMGMRGNTGPAFFNKLAAKASAINNSSLGELKEIEKHKNSYSKEVSRPLEAKIEEAKQVTEATPTQVPPIQSVNPKEGNLVTKQIQAHIESARGDRLEALDRGQNISSAVNLLRKNNLLREAASCPSDDSKPKRYEVDTAPPDIPAIGKTEIFLPRSDSNGPVFDSNGNRVIDTIFYEDGKIVDAYMPKIEGRGDALFGDRTLGRIEAALEAKHAKEQEVAKALAEKGPVISQGTEQNATQTTSKVSDVKADFTQSVGEVTNPLPEGQAKPPVKRSASDTGLGDLTKKPEKKTKLTPEQKAAAQEVAAKMIGTIGGDQPKPSNTYKTPASISQTQAKEEQMQATRSRRD